MEPKRQDRRGGGGRRRKAAPSRRRIRTSITWDEGTLRRLDVHCAVTGRERGDVLAELVDRHLTRYVVSDRGGPDRDREGRDCPAGAGEAPPLGVVA